MPSLSLNRRQIATVIAGVIISAVSWIAVAPWDMHNFMIGAPFGRDFINFWMAPRLVMSGHVATIADIPAYNALIRDLFDLTRNQNLLFVYPPHALLLLSPLSMIPFYFAITIWTTINLMALVTTLRLADAETRPMLAVAVCLSPPAMAMVMYGHMGGLLALCSTAAILARRRCPWLAGFCLACLTIKPQYACALGLILLLAGHWRCLFWAGITTSALIGLSITMFGFEAWHQFVTVTMPLQSSFITEFKANMIGTSVSAYFGARFWGLSSWLAWAIQAAVTAAALFVGVIASRQKLQTHETLLVVLLAALVMQPYVSHYDLAIVAPAMTAVVLGRDTQITPFMTLTWVLVPLAPVLLVLDLPLLCVIVPAALFAQTINFRRSAKDIERARPAHALASAA